MFPVSVDYYVVHSKDIIVVRDILVHLVEYILMFKYWINWEQYK